MFRGRAIAPLIKEFMSSPPLLNGPQAPYSNPPIQPQFYLPNRFVISAITLGQTTTITVTPANFNGISINLNYVIGQLVRFLIPQPFGTRQLDGQQGYVISLPATNQAEIAIDSSKYSAFISATSTQSPQVVAIGDINQGAINATGRVNNGTFIPGSFIDISPL